MADRGYIAPQGDKEKFSMEYLIDIIEDATVKAREKLEDIKEADSSISIGDMFELQMLMNELSQFSEASTAVASAAHTAIISMARNVKG
jgi:hypothetical protein